MSNDKSSKVDPAGKAEILAAIAKAQELARRYTADRPESSVDDFLAKRRSEWGDKDT
jgi:hypothetical protein